MTNKHNAVSVSLNTRAVADSDTAASGAPRLLDFFIWQQHRQWLSTEHRV